VRAASEPSLGLRLRGARRALGFPPVSRAAANGLLAVGGDLSPERLLVAYANGIFPWPGSEDPRLPWYCPSPRTVLVPGEVRVNASLRRALRRSPFTITFDRAFGDVITACALVPRKDDGTWITPSIVRAYTRLHDLGFAHSVEAWNGTALVGGVYGIALGAAFFGESMFTLESDASKIALFRLLERLAARNYLLLDCQTTTPHVVSMGAVDWTQEQFQARLAKALESDTERGPWPSVTPGVAG
jgi:leucyl/phenylalanyl-tRNA--protein transferase